MVNIIEHRNYELFIIKLNSLPILKINVFLSRMYLVILKIAQQIKINFLLQLTRANVYLRFIYINKRSNI